VTTAGASRELRGASRELQAARRELAAARLRFEREPSDQSSRSVRRAQIHLEDTVAIAQEWIVPNCPDKGIWT
jgi:hypothetical protein